LGKKASSLAEKCGSMQGLLEPQWRLGKTSNITLGRGGITTRRASGTGGRQGKKHHRDMGERGRRVLLTGIEGIMFVSNLNKKTNGRGLR